MSGECEDCGWTQCVCAEVSAEPISDVCRWDREVIEIWREHGGIPLDRSTVEYAWSIIRKLVAENDRLLDELSKAGL